MQFAKITMVIAIIGSSLAAPIDMADMKDLAKAAAKKPTAAAVMAASKNFAKDANTVSASLNSLGSTTDTKQIKALSSKAFAAESDEDAQRSVLAAASGSAGSASNAKIVKNTPTVLDGLAAMMKSPSTKTVTANLAKIEDARYALAHDKEFRYYC